MQKVSSESLYFMACWLTRWPLALTQSPAKAFSLGSIFSVTAHHIFPEDCNVWSVNRTLVRGSKSAAENWEREREREVFCSSPVSVRVQRQPTKSTVFNYQIRANYECLEIPLRNMLLEQKCQQTVGESVKLPECSHRLPGIQSWKWQNSFDLHEISFRSEMSENCFETKKSVSTCLSQQDVAAHNSWCADYRPCDQQQSHICVHEVLKYVFQNRLVLNGCYKKKPA